MAIWAFEFVALVTGVVAATGNGQGTDTGATDVPPTQAVSEQCFRYELLLSRTEFVLGEPIEVICKVTNMCHDARCISKWRGFLKGVGIVDRSGNHDFEIYYVGLDGASEPLKYCGTYVDSFTSPPTVTLAPGQAWEYKGQLNSAYDINRLGIYRIQSIYPDHCSNKNLTASGVTFVVKDPTKKELRALVPRLKRKEKAAMEIAAACCYQPALKYLAEIDPGEPRSIRSVQYGALARIGGPRAVRILGELVKKETDVLLRCDIVKSLGKSKNPEAIPYLRDLLTDCQVTADGSGDSAGKDMHYFGHFSVRHEAADQLTQMGVEVNVQLKEEISRAEADAIWADQRARHRQEQQLEESWTSSKATVESIE